MSLNDIRLPAQTVVDLYKNLICEDESISASVKTKFDALPGPTDQKVPVTFKTAEQINFLGKNLMRFVILVNYESEVHLPESQLNFIGNILKACKMNLGDVAIINSNKQRLTIEDLSRQLNPQYLVIFGVELNSLIQDNQVTPFNITAINGIQVFIAPQLELLNQETEEGKLLKSKLWLCMKKMLNL